MYKVLIQTKLIPIEKNKYLNFPSFSLLFSEHQLQP